MYVIIVNFEIDPEQIDAFLPLMRENASASHATSRDAGCSTSAMIRTTPAMYSCMRSITTAPLLTHICRRRISSRSMRRRPA